MLLGPHTRREVPTSATYKSAQVDEGYDGMLATKKIILLREMSHRSITRSNIQKE